MVGAIHETAAISTFDRFFTEKYDTRVNSWPLMNNPIPIGIIIASYLYFILKCGPKFMEKKKPYSLKTFIAIYNLGQIIACAYLMIEIFSLNPLIARFWECKVIKNNNDMRTAKLCYITFYVKLAELIETVCFVLRKKQTQITNLHVVHHCVTVTLSWLLTKYIGTSAAAFLFSVFLNSGVHIIMYSYYLTALLGTDVQRKLLPIKKLITIIQMAQFTTFLLQIGFFYFSKSDCKPPQRILILYLACVIYIFYKFYDFYRTAYLGRNKKQVVK